MTSISSVQSLAIDLPPSCVAFCPQHPDFFVVGTYFLHPSTPGQERATSRDVADKDGANDEATESAATASSAALQEQQEGVDSSGSLAEAQKRTGSLILYRLRADGSTITQVGTTQLDAAVLDVQWAPTHASDEEHQQKQKQTQPYPLLGVATSVGDLRFYFLDVEQGGLVHHATHRICEEQILVLSLAWHPSLADTVGVTLSDGRVCLVVAGSEQGFGPAGTDAPRFTSAGVAITDVTQHELEAWTLCFAPDPDDVACLIYSGGDDLALRCSSLVETLDPTPLWQDRRSHQAGVTAILALGHDDLVVTGSYDDHIRLLSAPAAGRRRVLAELNLGGGVWRLQRVDDVALPVQGRLRTGGSTRCSDSETTILASCMHAGTRVVQVGRQQRARARRSGGSISTSISISSSQHEGGGSWPAESFVPAASGGGVGDRSGGGQKHDEPEPELEWEWAFHVLAKFEEHRSMNYGSAVWPGRSSARPGVKTVVSTSFYDKLLCLWRVDVAGAGK